MRLSRVVLVFLLIGAPLRLQAQLRLGSEFQVNTATAGWQSYAEVDSNAGGDFVVIWDVGTPFDGDLIGQRFANDGSKLGGEFQVNATTVLTIGDHSVDVGDDGSFVIVWTAARFATPGLVDVFGRRYASDGTALGAEFQVNTYTPNYQAYPRVAREGDGDFAVVWLSMQQDGNLTGVFGRRFASSGAGLGTEFQINTYTPHSQMAVAIAGGGDGSLFVAWSSFTQDQSGDGVFGQRFDAAGARLGSEFQINTYTPGQQHEPSVARDAAGNFVVVWSSFEQDGDGYGVFGQRFASSGAAIGTEFRVNASTLAEQENADVVSAADGSFFVTWDNGGGPSDGDVFARRFDSSGSPVGGDFQINTYSPAGQFSPAVGGSAGGEVVVVWNSATQDGDDTGVFAQRLAMACPSAPIAVGCRTAGKSLVLFSDKSDSTKDKLLWKWLKGAAIDFGELGDPLTATAYTLCAYDADGFVAGANVAPGVSWKTAGASGYAFKDVSSGAISVAKLKAADAGKTKALVKGKGAGLPDPILPLSLPVRVQLLNSEGTCWEASYGTAIKNDERQFKAKF